MSSPDTRYRPTAEILAHVRADAATRVVRARRRRRLAGGLGVTAVIVVAALAVAIAGGGTDRDGQRTVGGQASTTTVALSIAPPLSPGESLPMAAAPISARSDAITAWTGSELLVWRGEGRGSDVCTSVDGGVMVCGDPTRSDGARYHLSSDTWVPMAESPMPAEPGSSMRSTVGVWTGAELVVWGGPGPDAAAYDPVTDSWRSIDPGPLAARDGANAVWTGEEMVIVGGVARSRSNGEPLPSAALDPATGTWRDLPAPPGTSRPFGAGAVWTGESVVLETSAWGGPLTLAALDPAARSWSEVPAPSVQEASSMTVDASDPDDPYLVVTGVPTADEQAVEAVRIAIDEIGERRWSTPSVIADGFDVSVLSLIHI